MKVIWVGSDRMIPGIGLGVKGNVITMSNSMANSFISQGLATKFIETEKRGKGNVIQPKV